MRVGIFGGSFNPIHNEHLRIADETYRKLNLDELIFIPTYNALHKAKNLEASYNDRFEMLKLAIIGNDCYRVSDIEYKLDKNSYTYYTCLNLKNRYKSDELYFIMGWDSYLNFCTWYNWENLFKLCKFVVLGREGMLQKKNEILEIHPLAKEHLTKLNFTGKELSSSEIRHKIQKNESITGLVPSLVERYIKKHELYRNNRLY